MNRPIVLALWAMAPLACVQPSAFAQTPVRFSIAPQALDSALIAFATEAHVSLSMPPEGLGSLHSGGLSGSLAPDKALATLLAGTGYAFRQVGPVSYLIFKAPGQMRPPAAGPVESAPDVVIVSARLPIAQDELPRDVTRLEADQLTAGGMTSDQDLAVAIGALSFTNLGPGRNKVLLRGLSDGAITGRTQSLVGLYFDATRITYNAPDPDLQLVDISSVEVLRGPQGALYGAGAMAGIMRISTNAPDADEWSGSLFASAEQTEGGADGNDVELILNAPVIPGVLGVRGALYREKSGGWLDNSTTGDRNTNSVRRRGGRISAELALSDDWSLGLSALNQQIDNSDSQYLVRSPSGLSRSSAIREPHDNDFSLLNVTLKGSTRWGDLSSSTSYLRHQYGSRFDASGTFAALSAPSGAVQSLDDQDSLAIFVHETTLASAPETALPWFIGIFYADGDTRREVALRQGSSGVWGGVDYGEIRVDDINELALFGEATLPISASLSLSAGLRLFRSTLSTRSTVTEALLARQAATSGGLTFTGAAPDIRLLYHPSRNLQVFLSAAKGYRSAGFNSGGPLGQQFSPTLQPLREYGGDHIWTYELGARLSLLEDRLDLRVTAFDSDWHGVQTDQLISNGFVYTGNVGDARASGVEVDGSFNVSDRVTLAVHALANEPEITHPSMSFPLVADGGLPGSPEYSGSMSVRYADDVALAGGDRHVFAQLDASYVGASTLGFGAGDRIGDYTAIDLRTGLTFKDWDVQLAVENLGDSGGATYSFGNPYQPGWKSITPLRPRTVSLSMRRSF